MKLILFCKTCGNNFEAEVKRTSMPPSTCLVCNPRRKYPPYRNRDKANAYQRAYRQRSCSSPNL